MILDVFKIMFEADTSKADAGVEKARRSTDDLVDSMQKADSQAGVTSQSLSGLATKALGALTAILSTGQAISGAIGRAEDIAAIERTSNALGIATEDVDAFGRAMTQLGGDAQGARDSLTDMAESIGEALQDVESGRAKTFGALGVSLKDVDGQSIDAVEGLMRVADAVAGMSQGEAVFRIKELGITDNRTVEALLKGRKELERLMMAQKESNPLTKEQVERAKQLNETMGAWRNAVGGAASQFFDMLIPAISKVVEWMTVLVNWASEHKDLVVGFFIAVGAIVAAVYLPAMLSAAAATLAATWPIIAVVAALAALAAVFALVYDDIMNFIDGNDSMIGRMIEQYPIIGTLIDAIAAAFKTLMEWGGMAFDFLKSAGSAWLEGVKLMADGVISYFKFIADAWSKVFGGIMAGVDKAKGALSAVGGFLGISSSEEVSHTIEGMELGGAQLASASSNAMNSISSSAISNTSNSSRETSVQVGEVIVQTQATDAQGISRDIGSELGSQLKNLEAETATGVDR